MPAVSPPATASNCSNPASRMTIDAPKSISVRRTRGNEISRRQSVYTGLAHPEVKMKGLSAMNRTASTSRNIFAVRSAMTCRSGKLAVMDGLFFLKMSRVQVDPVEEVEVVAEPCSFSQSRHTSIELKPNSRATDSGVLYTPTSAIPRTGIRLPAADADFIPALEEDFRMVEIMALVPTDQFLYSSTH